MYSHRSCSSGRSAQCRSTFTRTPLTRQATCSKYTLSHCIRTFTMYLTTSASNPPGLSLGGTIPKPHRPRPQCTDPSRYTCIPSDPSWMAWLLTYLCETGDSWTFLSQALSSITMSFSLFIFTQPFPSCPCPYRRASSNTECLRALSGSKVAAMLWFLIPLMICTKGTQDPRC